MDHSIFDRGLERLGAMRMTVNGLRCTFNMPPALECRYDSGGNEIDQALPPYGPRTAFNVDEFDKACPQNWMRGDAKSGSFFVPIKPEHGLWLDFNANDGHTHHVAVRVSIQGVCAITGLPTEGRMHLEQYREQCPKHNVPFGANRFCKESGCGFKWPDQNYLATTGAKHGLFWLDGFRAKDGCTRQFVFTEEEMRGVAKQLIGDKRVFAIGLAFYLSKEPKPRPVERHVLRRMAAFDDLGGGGLHSLGGGPALGTHAPHVYKGAGALVPAGGHMEHFDGLEEICVDEVCLMSEESAPIMVVDDIVMSAPAVEEMSFAATPPVAQPARRAPRPKHLEIAAGARINQPIHRDPSELSFWQDEPAAIIYINYCDEATAREILSQGKEDRTAHGEGFMDGLVVGHPAHTGQ